MGSSLHHLWSVSQEAPDPGAECDAQSQVPELGDQPEGNYNIKWRTVIDEQQTLTDVQVGEGGV